MTQPQQPEDLALIGDFIARARTDYPTAHTVAVARLFDQLVDEVRRRRAADGPPAKPDPQGHG